MASTQDTELPDRPEYMLTTVDNPFDPFTEWDSWFAWDEAAGYHSAGLLARIAHSSDELAESDQHAAIQNAIDEIIHENVLGVSRKVKRGDVQALKAQGFSP